MQIKEALRIANERLLESSTPQLDARLLLSKILNFTHEQLLLSYNQELKADLEDKFFQLVNRRQAMEPVAYILGEQEFYGLNFVVSKDVLIPRPDTELLVDILIKKCKEDSAGQEIRILELGTGSGAIAIALAANVPSALITATDISIQALLVAKQNADLNKVSRQINFKQSNWYQNIDLQKYDYIISNPPYIDKKDKEFVAKETYMFEPELALYAENQGLKNYQIIIESAYKYLKPHGQILLEIGYNQKEAIFSIFRRRNYSNLDSYKDLANHDRVVGAEYIGRI